MTRRRRLRRPSFPVRCAPVAGGRAAQGYGAAPPASRLLRIACGDDPCGAGLDPGDHCGPSGRKHGQALACPARGAARPVSPCPAHKLTPGIKAELAFDSQKNGRNYKNPLTGSVHASRGLPPDVLVAVEVLRKSGASLGETWRLSPKNEATVNAALEAHRSALKAFIAVGSGVLGAKFK